MSERETHFQGFAKLLWDELLNVRERGYIDVSDGWLDQEFNDEYRQIIAERAYDLALHIANQTDSALREHVIDFYETPPDVPEIVQNIPDLIEWPKYEQ